MNVTHEAFLAHVVALARQRVTPEERALLEGIKMVYGAGQRGLRGVTYYGRWRNGHPTPQSFVEVCAFGEESWVQLAGTCLHELAHVLAHGDGHGREWRAACERLGLRRARAAGHRYLLSGFAPEIRSALALGPKPSDGAPVASLGNGRAMTLRPCGAGLGARGGTSRGTGSGSRLRKCVCTTCGYLARTTSKWLDAMGPPHCPAHGAMQAE